MDDDLQGRPPRLLPGLSAWAWESVQTLAMVLGIASLITWIWLSIHPEFLLFSVAAVAFYVWASRRYEDAAYRERDGRLYNDVR